MKAWLLITALVAGTTFARQPNVILILADDLGYETLRCNGGESYDTPHLDQLAASGMRFTQCHVQPLCTPTRVMLMTGKSNLRNYTHFGHLDPSQRTFGHVFREAGYSTAVVGKWQLGGGMQSPHDFGFEDYCLWQLTRRPERYRNPGVEVNGVERDYTNGEYGPDIVQGHGLAFLERCHDQPFLLYYPMMLTHSPFEPTPDSPDYGKKTKGNHFPDMVRYMDKQIGILVDRLQSLGLRDHTLLLFVGDNGTGSSVQSQWQGHLVKGGKGSRTGHGSHVPMIASWPGRIPAGKVCHDLIDASDFLPTICDATGLTKPEGLDGRSFWPQLQGQPGTPREWLYTWYNRSGGATAAWESARDVRYKLYRSGELYDVIADELETAPLKDLSDEAQAAKAKLAEVLALHHVPRPVDFIASGQLVTDDEDAPQKGKKK
jgi:arylsulfatase A